MSAFFDRHTRALGLFVAAVAFVCLFPDLILRNHGQDLFIYRGGAALALAGQSPYDAPGLSAMVAAQFVEDEHADFRANHGFFLSPVGVALFAPFAVLPWGLATWAFAALSYALAGLGAWHLFDLASPATRERFGGVGRVGLMAVVLWDPILFIGTIVAQTSAAGFGLVVVGEMLRRRGSAWAGAVCWAAVFAKPHTALILLPLAWYAGGWRHLLRVGVATAALMAAGIAASGGPAVIPRYVDQLQTGHKLVEFNKVTWNPQLTSWNRALVAAGGPPIELDATRTLAGYAACAALIAARVLRSGRPTPAWAFAAGAMAATEACQLGPYELMLAALVLPLALDWRAGGKAGRAPALWLGVGLVLKSIPYEVSGEVWNHHLEHGSPPEWLAWLALSTRSLGVLVVASGVVLWGWPRRDELDPARV